MGKTKLIFVGGFLGAGKTTLLNEVSKRLVSGGISVGLITNDQAPDLVDTKLLGHNGIIVSEVTGSCFCCDFKALRRAIDKIGLNQETEILLAEPVGSCADLSATLINPIKDMMKTEVSVSPLTVLADPRRLREILQPGTSDLHPGAAYIIRKQLEESDIIAITKSDLYAPEEITLLSGKLKENFPECEIMAISTKNGEGIDDWLEIVLDGREAGRQILDIDYDKYAGGEASLGWLNGSVSLSGKEVDWDNFARSFMINLAAEFDKQNSAVGHVKIIVERGDRYISANLTGRIDTLTYRWSAGTGDNAEMTVNARVVISPEELKELFLNTLDRTTKELIKTRINRLMSISPGYPKPTYRYNK